MYKLSIIIPVFNKANFTRSCLKDLVQLGNDHEIIVVNNGSSDHTDNIITGTAKEYNNIVNIKLSNNLGFAAACNIGYEESTSDNVLFLNNDIRVKDNHSNWTDNLLKHCSAALVGPTMGLLDQKLNFIKEANATLKGNSYLSGWCLAGSKKQFNKLILKDNVGPFSTEFGIAYFEDTDLSFRAKQLNIPLKIISVPVVHFGKQTSQQLNTLALYTGAKKIFLKKWRQNNKKKARK